MLTFCYHQLCLEEWRRRVWLSEMKYVINTFYMNLAAMQRQLLSVKRQISLWTLLFFRNCVYQRFFYFLPLSTRVIYFILFTETTFFQNIQGSRMSCSMSWVYTIYPSFESRFADGESRRKSRRKSRVSTFALKLERRKTEAKSPPKTARREMLDNLAQNFEELTTVTFTICRKNKNCVCILLLKMN